MSNRRAVIAIKRRVFDEGVRQVLATRKPPKVEKKPMQSLLLFTPYTALVSALLETRQGIDTSVICGQFDSLVIGPYTLFNDQFGSGSQSLRKGQAYTS